MGNVACAAGGQGLRRLEVQYLCVGSTLVACAAGGKGPPAPCTPGPGHPEGTRPLRERRSPLACVRTYRVSRRGARGAKPARIQDRGGASVSVLTPPA